MVDKRLQPFPSFTLPLGRYSTGPRSGRANPRQSTPLFLTTPTTTHMGISRGRAVRYLNSDKPARRVGRRRRPTSGAWWAWVVAPPLAGRGGFAGVFGPTNAVSASSAGGADSPGFAGVEGSCGFPGVIIDLLGPNPTIALPGAK